MFDIFTCFLMQILLAKGWYTKPVVPNLFVQGPIIYFWRAWGATKSNFLHYPPLFSPLLPSPPTARGLGSAVSSHSSALPAGSGAEPQLTTHFRAFYGKKWSFWHVARDFPAFKATRFSPRFVIFTITGIAAHTLPAYPCQNGKFYILHIYFWISLGGRGPLLKPGGPLWPAGHRLGTTVL